MVASGALVNLDGTRSSDLDGDRLTYAWTQTKDVLLVALTGYGRDEDKKQAMAAGFDYHLVKPVKPEALKELVARLGHEELAKRPTIQ